MAINMEYRRKLKCLIDNMLKRSYHSLGKIELCGFLTYDRLTLAEAAEKPKEKFNDGQAWGRKWQYGWFFGEVTLPPSALNKEICFKLPLGECIAFVNKRIVGAFDKKHDIKHLSGSGVPGERYEIAAEVYAGHDGPVPAVDRTHAVFMLPELNVREFPDDVTQKTYRHGSYGIYHREVDALHTDIKVLSELRDNIDGESYRAASIDKGLKRVCDTVDIEAPFDVFIEQVKCARKILRPLFECKNGSSAPTAYAVGHSHLDLEWLWTTNETVRKCARTLGNQVELIKRYPEYKYIQSQPWILHTVKKNYPELYSEVKEAVRNGSINVEGGMWVEADTLIPSGESLIRQFALGKRFISEEFGKETEIFWLPDSFGVSACMPQIMKGCGIKYFMNAKVQWAYNGGDVLPHNSFSWQGTDGSEILTHIIQGYSLDPTPATLIRKCKENAEKEDVPIKLIPFGHGDGGGGATNTQLEYLRREGDLEGMPKVVISDANEFFRTLEGCNIAKTFVGELYYSCHRGTYTSQARTKLLNRRCELALRDAEAFTAFLNKDRSAEIGELWRTVLFNQFHDIIPGSSISAVYDVAEKEYCDVLAKASGIVSDTLASAITVSDDTVTVFNSLSWERQALITLPEKGVRLYSMDEAEQGSKTDGAEHGSKTVGREQETETVGDSTVALVSVPSFGHRSFKLVRSAPSGDAESLPDSHDLVLENSLIKVCFNGSGELISAVEKDSGFEYLCAPSNVLRMYQDMPTYSDAWDIDSFYESTEVDTGAETSVGEVRLGRLSSSITFVKKFASSEMKQTVTLRKDSRALEFKTEIDWNETHKLLKTDFCTNIRTDGLVSEIQFGNIKRPNHKNTQYDADRFEVFQHKWSALCESGRYAAILNDCKYGISSDGGKMSLTLLKSAMNPALNADKGHHVFTYAFMFSRGSIADGRVIKAAYELNCPVSVARGCAEERSYLSVSADNVIVETVKTAFDGSGDTVIRLYEAAGTLTEFNITFSFDIEEAFVTDMLEQNGVPIEHGKNSISLTLEAFKVMTLRLRVKK